MCEETDIVKEEIFYKISTFPSKFLGYQEKKGKNGTIKLFITSIWGISQDFNKFLEEMIFTLILERICLERAFQKIRMKNRCNPCKMERFAVSMYLHIIENTKMISK